jgi:hypothetical protein
MKPDDRAALAEGIDRAIDELLAVRVALSDAPVALPDLALDEALRRHPSYQAGRQEFAGAIEALLDSPWDGLPAAVLDVESAANAMVGRAFEVAWQLALRVR